MDNDISSLIHAMVQTERSGRSAPLAAALRDIKGSFGAKGALGHGRLPVDLDSRAAEDYEQRARAYLGIAKRVMQETETPWTRDARAVVLHTLTTELVTDWEELVDALRRAVGQQGRARIELTEAAKNRAAAVLEQETSLQLLRQERTRLPLIELLGAPRYVDVLAAWRKADDASRGIPPDFAHAAKEAIGAVEALARILVGEPSATLGECVKRLRSHGQVAGPALKGIEELWGIGNATPGVRHGASASVDEATARYVVHISQAALNLLLSADSA